MTIDEAIAFCYEKSNNIKLKAEPQVFIQLAEWLEEFKVLRLQNHLGRDEALIAGRKEGYNKAIDDFVKACKENIMYKTFGLRECDIEKIAEQLKAGEENE